MSRDEFPGLRLPSKFTALRPSQVDAIRQVMDAFERRSIVFLDAPTGAGKTVIGESVRQLSRLRFEHRAGLYVCTSRGLQDQFLEDFPYARTIKGRSNYPTLDDPLAFGAFGDRRITAANCTKRTTDGPVCAQCDVAPADLFEGDTEEWKHCHRCHPWQYCPYEQAKNDALRSELAVANTAYYLTEANFVGRFGRKVNKLTGEVSYPFGLVVVDEADTIEDVLMSFIELKLSRSLMRSLNLDVPKFVSTNNKGNADGAVWVEWLDKVVELAKARSGAARRALEARETDTRAQRDLDTWETLKTQAEAVSWKVRNNPQGWVLEGRAGDDLTFKPIDVRPYAREILWDHAPRWLLMSATLISADQMAADLGLLRQEWELVKMDSSFPTERRPVVVRPAAFMSYKQRDTCEPKMAWAVRQVVNSHPGERILVHTVSYARSRYLYDYLAEDPAIAHRLLTYESSAAREPALESFKHKDGAVMLAASFDRGVDLPNDDCRVQIITKIPFAPTNNPQVSARMYSAGGEGWYATQTIRTLVQMTGRGMRHENDWCTTYLLDAAFQSRVWGNDLWRNRLPDWWKSAVVWEAPR